MTARKADGRRGAPVQQPDDVADPAVVDAFEQATLWGGRRSGPGLLNEWERAGKLNTAELRAVILGVWDGAEYPVGGSHPQGYSYWENSDPTMTQGRWLQLFRRTGFVSASGAGRPTEPLTVYRGCTPWGIRRMSWTTDLDMGLFFAERYRGGQLYRATVKPAAVLAMLDDPAKGRREGEVIVNPRSLRSSATPVHLALPTDIPAREWWPADERDSLPESFDEPFSGGYGIERITDWR